jgi:UDP-glucose 4-epimerase
VTVVLVTGASGFVGRRVAGALAARGVRVRAHGRTLPAARPSSPDIEHRAGDLEDTASLPGLVDGVSAVCHLAAFLPPDMADSSFAERCYRVNALASLRLAEAALAGGPRRFVLASSANAYAPGPRPVAEDEVPYPAGRATYYLASKLAAELYLDHLARTRGLPLTTLRLSAVYGPGMPESAVVARFMALAAAGQPLTVRDGGVPRTDFVYVDDVVDLVVRALLDPVDGADGAFNVGSGQHTSLSELAAAVRATYPERPVEIRTEPPSAEPAPGFAALDIRKAQRVFGHAPRGLAEGLAAFRAAGEYTK